MKHELFDPCITKNTENIISKVKKCYPQERDWTCCFACIRTLLTDPPEEDFFSKDLEPGPFFSKDVLERKILSGLDVKYGCEEQLEFDGILDLMKQGYNVMVECMINYSHWVVILGYYPKGEQQADNYLLIFDPYYNEVRLIRTEELMGMWCDGEPSPDRVMFDYIAIRN